jgi:ribosomal protein L32
MLGLSLGKTLLLAVFILLVWVGFRYMRRVEVIRRALHEELARREARRQPQRIEAEDLVKCHVCGDYVAPRSASGCGRADCPRR